MADKATTTPGSAPDSRKISDAIKKRTKSKKEKNTFKEYAMWIGGVIVLIVAALVMLIISPERTVNQIPVNDDQLISQVNSQSTSFKAAPNSFFESWTLANVKSLGGISVTAGAQRVPVCAVPGDVKIPTEFDARQKWATCFEDKEVYSGGNCTSSWAIAAASTMTNRFCIADPANLKDLELSPQTLLSCDQQNRGCEGGDLDTLWDYITTQGLVSETCMPFKASSEVGCETKCANEPAYKIASHCVVHGEDAIQREIMMNGPVVSPVFLHDDFLVYKSGVYRTLPTASRVTDKNRMVIIHAVKLIGWGVDKAAGPYWLVENSWGNDWGDKGFGKIVRGKDTIMIENFVITGAPQYMPVSGESEETEKATKRADFEELDMDEDEEK